MKQSLTPSVTTEKIWTLASGDNANWLTADHYKKQLNQRDIISSDIKHLLRTGYVYAEGTESSVSGLWKYRMEGKTPNSNNRTIAVVVIPDFSDRSIKFVTVFWRDSDG